LAEVFASTEPAWLTARRERAVERMPHLPMPQFRGVEGWEFTEIKGFDIDSYVAMNLIGSIDEVCERVEGYRRAGADHLAGLLFVGNSVEEMLEQFQLFAEAVVPKFTENPRVT
jgi:hypothetical protein